MRLLPDLGTSLATRLTAGRTGGVRRSCGALRVLGSFVLASLFVPAGLVGQVSELVWEDEYGDGDVATPIDIDGTVVSIFGLDPWGVGSGGNFTVNDAERGAHNGYWESGLNATNASQFLTFTLSFSQPVDDLSFSLLDIDTNNIFHDSVTVTGWNGSTSVATTVLFVGPSAANVGGGAFSGRASVGNGSTDGNVDLRFDQVVDSVTFEYGPGPNAAADPGLQVLGLSDLTWTVPCVSTMVVNTTAQLRSAVANPCVQLILMVPGTYDLTASGADELRIREDKTLRNLGGGEVIIDAGGASRVMRIDSDIAVELDGLTITGGSESADGGGIRSEADLVIRNSTITGNFTDSRGGGLFMRRGTLLMENVTVSGNIANDDGGGLDIRQGARLVHVTVANNSGDRGGGINSRDQEVELVNSIVADNVSAQGRQIRREITSLGINLVEGGCNGCKAADLTGDPTLLPLAPNGGDSRTHALDASSIARDAAAAGVALPVDQRGVARPQGAGFDVGSYEATPVISVTLTAAAATANRLPSNGTVYQESFTLTNTGPGSSAYELGATSTGNAVVVDSIRGPGVTYGVQPDSALTSTLAGGGASVTVDVFYTVPDTAAGIVDPLTLTATSVVVPSASGSDVTTVTVVRPFLGVTKIATVAGDTIPGAPITYQITITNLGSREAVDVVVVDSLPPQVDFLVGSTSEALPAAIGTTLEFDDGTDSWSYTPVSAGCGGAAGYDRCVRSVRWTLDSPLAAIGPDNSADFYLVTRIR